VVSREQACVGPLRFPEHGCCEPVVLVVKRRARQVAATPLFGRNRSDVSSGRFSYDHLLALDRAILIDEGIGKHPIPQRS
jgi:hypothetical protein